MKVSKSMEQQILATPGVVVSKPVQLPTPAAEPIAEKDFQAQVIKRAKELGWLVYHTHDSRKSEAGYPDLTMVRDRVVFAELKSEDGTMSAAQLRWWEAFATAGALFFVWRPKDWPEIEKVLA